jgi:hypothetical protein
MEDTTAFTGSRSSSFLLRNSPSFHENCSQDLEQVTKWTSQRSKRQGMSMRVVFAVSCNGKWRSEKIDDLEV